MLINQQHILLKLSGIEPTGAMQLHQHVRLLCTLWLFGHALCMFQKRAAPEEPEGSDAKKMRADLENLFLTNTASASRTQSLVKHAQALAVKANEHDPALKKN